MVSRISTRSGSGARRPPNARRRALACPTRDGQRITLPSSGSDASNIGSARLSRAGPLPATAQPMSPAVRFVNVCRHFGPVRAVDGVTLDIAEGEFFAMLGPSGSGKTTCLRLIAGFEQPTEGHIEIFGETAEGVPPYKRNVNTVFQDYALFPHMTVGENVAYGLRIKGVPRAERERRARDALAMVKLAGYEDRRPSQL